MLTSHCKGLKNSWLLLVPRYFSHQFLASEWGVIFLGGIVPESDKQTLDNIEEYGCHVLGTLEDDDPAFTYSVGIYEKQQRAEVIVVGLNNSLAHSMVNKYNLRIKQGELFEFGKFYSDFLEGFDVCFIDVAEKYHNEYSLACNTHYGEGEYKLVQMIWPTTGDRWPWDKDTSEFYQWAQPILNETGELKNITSCSSGTKNSLLFRPSTF